MLRKVTLVLFMLLAVSQNAVAGPNKFTLTPSDPTNPASGTFQITNGKPTDDVCRLHLSLNGLTPDAGYYLEVSGPDGYHWDLGIFTDDRGSCTVRGTAGGKLSTATEVKIIEGMTSKVILTGK